MIHQVKILKTDLLSHDKYILKKIKYEYVKEDGSRHEKINEVYERGNAAAVLLYHKGERKVILARQFRLPTYLNGNASGMLIETCAGMLDDDTPEDCARREAEEETGYRIRNLSKVFEVYTSPGSVTEIIYLFIAEYDKTMKVNDGGGLEEEQENIDVMRVDFERAMDMINTGEIKDAKTIMLLQYLKLNNIL